MSISEFTITLHNTDNSAPKTTARDQQRELFRAWYGKYIAVITTVFVMVMTFIYSVFSIQRIEYLPSAVILMVTLWIISTLLERSEDK